MMVLFPLIKLAKKLKEARKVEGFGNLEGKLFPLIKLAKKLKENTVEALWERIERFH